MEHRMGKRAGVRGLLAALVIGGAMACQAAGPADAGQPQQSARVRPDLYACEGCDAIYERDHARLEPRTAMIGADEPGEKLAVRGTVYQSDGATPAPGVVIYAHQTNARGAYAGGTNETEWSRRHGRIRGWVKSGTDGRYELTTVKPAPYPTHTEPAHIHLIVLEPGRRPYYIDDIVFDGEYRVDQAYRQSRENRGGSGIVGLEQAPDGSWTARRDITLEPHPE